MATDKAWEKLEEMFGAVDRISPRDIYVAPEEPMDDAARDILRRMNQDEELTREEVLQLPSRFQEVYYFKRDAKLEQPMLARRYKKKLRDEQRRKKYEKEKFIYERALRKMQGRLTLTPQEIAIYQKFSSKIYHANVPEVQINPMDILNDVVKGDYTLQDVNLAQDGTEVRPVEKSPMKLLEKVVEDTKKRTQNTLNANDSAQFFQNIDSDAFSRITPIQLDNIISSCTTGIDMMQETDFDENEARSACESLLKALVMQEGETKIKSAIEEAKKRCNRKNIERLAEAGAVAVALEDDLTEEEKEESSKQPKSIKNLGFNITNDSFDISFVPSEDPDVYKPLEIISYIGMTK